MKSVNNVGYMDERAYYHTSANAKSSNNFDSVLEQETIIYATPASSGSQGNVNGSSAVPTTTPANLEAIFNRAANEYGIDIDLLKAVAKTESNFDPNATSAVGAMGIMQLMPSTASYLGVTNAYDPEENIMGGAKYLKQMLDKYNGNLSLSLAAYNAGPGNVDKYNGIPPFEETQNYVKKVLTCMGENPSTYTAQATYFRDKNEDTAYITATPDTSRVTATSDISTVYAVAANDATLRTKLYLDE